MSLDKVLLLRWSDYLNRLAEFGRTGLESPWPGLLLLLLLLLHLHLHLHVLLLWRHHAGRSLHWLLLLLQDWPLGGGSIGSGGSWRQRITKLGPLLLLLLLLHGKVLLLRGACIHNDAVVFSFDVLRLDEVRRLWTMLWLLLQLLTLKQIAKLRPRWIDTASDGSRSVNDFCSIWRDGHDSCHNRLLLVYR